MSNKEAAARQGSVNTAEAAAKQGSVNTAEAAKRENTNTAEIAAAIKKELETKIAVIKTGQSPAKAEPAFPVPPPIAAAGSWGVIENIDASDLLVPKIYHQQAMSKFVADGKARPGDFCDSITGEVLAGKDKKLELIIFGSFKEMLIKKLDVMSNQWRLEKTISITAKNAAEWANAPFKQSLNGDEYSNNLQYNYYCLIPGRMNEVPFVLSLGSTKLKVAKKLNLMFLKLHQLKRPGASVVFEFSSVQEKNDKGQWFGLEVGQGRDATKEEQDIAYEWYLKSKMQKFVAMEEDEQQVESSGDDLPF